MTLAANYKTKKALKASVGKPLRFTETSFYGNEYVPTGKFSVVGPSANKRVWFAEVAMKDGLIAKVS